MNLIDKNQTLLPPEGYEFTGLSAEGAYLRLEYRRIGADKVSTVTIYLNDWGREVVRSVNDSVDPVVEAEKFPQPHYVLKEHLTWWSQIKLWWALWWDEFTYRFGGN